MDHDIDSCSASLRDGVLALGNAVCTRRWRIGAGGALLPLSLAAGGREWLRPADRPGTTPPSAAADAVPVLTVRRGRETPVEPPSLVAELACGAVVWRFQIFPGVAAITIRLLRAPAGGEAGQGQGVAAASGIEADPSRGPAGRVEDGLCERLLLSCRHAHVHGVRLADQTDIHDNLAEPYERRIAPSEPLHLSGCIFAVEDPLTGDGLVLLKHAPLPHARPRTGADDLRTWHEGGFPAVALLGHGAEAGGAGDAWTLGAYRGGAAGRTMLAHAIQRCFRTYRPGRDGLLISNTWGDRSRDARVDAAFAAREIAAGAALGVDAVQIDDGWQRGISANSVHRQQGGVWQGFWAADPGFWQPHPQRFPDGLGGTAALARAQGVGLGLWFAPDSSGSFSNWRRDADAVLGLWREHGVTQVKIDGVKAVDRLGGERLQAFFAAVIAESGGAVAFDLDVTAEIRPGYFGAMGAGPVFVENRYTDWHRWWPHATLRNLWQLAHWVDPVRLRMEFLNRTRNVALYGDDPLAPMACDPAYIFASVMVASPLAWCEVSALPEAEAGRLRPIIALWKRHRAALHGGSILPIGECPSGAARTGFLSLGADAAYLVALRERSPRAEACWELPLPAGAWQAEVLAGEGAVDLAGGCARVRWDRELAFVFARLSRRG